MKCIIFPGTLRTHLGIPLKSQYMVCFFVHRSLKFSKRRRTLWRTASASPSPFMACKCCSLRISVSDVGTFVEVLKASVCFKQFLYDNTSKGKIRVWLFGMVPLQQGEGRYMMNCITLLNSISSEFGICSMRNEQRANPVNHLHTWPTPAWR